MSSTPLRLPAAAILAVALGSACSAAQVEPVGSGEVLAPEPTVEVEAPPETVPDPTARERWESPFAVTGVGRAVVRPPRDILVLGADSAIAEGLARREAAARPASVAGRTGAGPRTEMAAVQAGSNARNQPASATTPSPAGPGPDRARSGLNAQGPTATAPPSSVNRAVTDTGPGAPASSAGTETAPPVPANRAGAGAVTTAPASGPGREAAPTAPASSSARGPVVLLGEEARDGGSVTRAGSSASAAVGSTAVAATPARDGAAGAGRTSAAAEGGGERMALHVVEAGENWSRIVIRFRVSSQALAAANPGVDPNLIRTGQILNIPIPTSSPASRSHRVGPGETLRGIATRYDTTADEIRRLNAMDDERVTMGETLLIPPSRGAEGDGR